MGHSGRALRGILRAMTRYGDVKMFLIRDTVSTSLYRRYQCITGIYARIQRPVKFLGFASQSDTRISGYSLTAVIVLTSLKLAAMFLALGFFILLTSIPHAVADGATVEKTDDFDIVSRQMYKCSPINLFSRPSAPS